MKNNSLTLPADMALKVPATNRDKLAQDDIETLDYQNLSVLFDKVSLEAKLEFLQAQSLNDNDLRKQVTFEFQKALDVGRNAIKSRFMRDHAGLGCAKRLSKLEDELIAMIFTYVCNRVLPLNTHLQIAIIAVGGYGRGTLAPSSDIDLLFLLPSKLNAREILLLEKSISGLLYILWDLGQKVGHATRTIEECIVAAKSDMTICTSLLETRFLMGHEALFHKLNQKFQTEIVTQGVKEFVAAKLAERERRVIQAGNSRYLVEPNVKEGKGGLRDLNTLFWIAKYVYRVQSPQDLIANGLFSPSEWARFCRCEEFLWRVRCHLHFLTGRAEERLGFDRQRQIADALKYADHDGLSGTERFMRRYFLVAKDVGDLTAILCAALEQKHTKPHTMLDRFMQKIKPSRRAISGFKDFAVEINRITVSHKTVFQDDPINLIRLYWLADRSNLAIHPDATRAVTESLRLIDETLRNSPEANALFIDILTSKNAPEIVLRRMNEAGVLGRFIPDFGKIVAMMQFNMYHHYTVDEHLLRSVGILSGIENGALEADHPLAKTILPSITNRKALYVALFLHDIAKGRKEDHSLAGAEVARKLCPRFGLTQAETETAVWLIEYHLLMSTVAQSRDLSDPQTITKFASTVQTLERLKLLLILTICDIRAVGPGVWNGWKGQLLRTLYFETEIILAGGHSALNRSTRVLNAQEELKAQLKDWREDEFASYQQRHYPAYWLKVDMKRKLSHAALLKNARAQDQLFLTDIATDKFRGVTELTIVAPDHPRLLAIVAGACFYGGANIVDAQIFTTTDGYALDSFFISRAFHDDHDEMRRGYRVADIITKALKSELRVSELILSKNNTGKSKNKIFAIAPDVTLDNNLSHNQTVIEISGLDRPGLLYDLTTELGKLNLNITSAHVATFGEKAVDVFYVTDLTGLKITGHNKQAIIRRKLLKIFE